MLNRDGSLLSEKKAQWISTGSTLSGLWILGIVILGVWAISSWMSSSSDVAWLSEIGWCFRSVFSASGLSNFVSPKVVCFSENILAWHGTPHLSTLTWWKASKHTRNRGNFAIILIPSDRIIPWRSKEQRYKMSSVYSCSKRAGKN